MDYFSKADHERIEELKNSGYEIYTYGFGVPSTRKNSLYYQIKQEIIDEGLDYKVVYGKRFFNAYNFVFLTKKITDEPEEE